MNLLFQNISRCSLDLRHDRTFPPGKYIEQRRFPCIRLSEDHGLDSLFDDPPVSRRIDQLFQFFPDRNQFLFQRLSISVYADMFGIIQRGFNKCRVIQQSFPHCFDLLFDTSAKLADRTLQRIFILGRDHIDHRFRL